MGIDITGRKRIEDELSNSERKMKTMLQNILEGIVTVDLTGQITFANKAAEEILDIGKDILGKYYHSREWRQIDENGEPYPQDKLPLAIALSEKRVVKNIEHGIAALDGKCKWLSVSASPLINDDGMLYGGIANFVDITARKNEEKALMESELNYRTLADSGQALIWLSGTDKLCLYFNRIWLEFTGRTLEQELGNGWTEGVHPEDFQQCLDIYTRSFDRQEKFSMEYRLRYHDGEYRWILDDGAPRYDGNGKFSGYIGHCLDITERKLSENKINLLLAEKELILKEVHHRIKNNMSIMKGLFFLQADAAKDSSIASALHDAENRVTSMMVLYDKLYRSNDFDNLSAREYIVSLIDQIISNYPDSGNVKIKEDIEDFILSVKILSSIGIIINELLTNIMKYAFNGSENRVINISASKKGNLVTLVVGDNGKGMPDSINFKNSPGFGMQLVGMLSEQIEGNIKIERVNGTRFVLKFKVQKTYSR